MPDGLSQEWTTFRFPMELLRQNRGGPARISPRGSRVFRGFCAESHYTLRLPWVGEDALSVRQSSLHWHSDLTDQHGTESPDVTYYREKG